MTSAEVCNKALAILGSNIEPEPTWESEKDTPGYEEMLSLALAVNIFERKLHLASADNPTQP